MDNLINYFKTNGLKETKNVKLTGCSDGTIREYKEVSYIIQPNSLPTELVYQLKYMFDGNKDFFNNPSNEKNGFTLIPMGVGYFGNKYIYKEKLTD